jgi:hypothetical protein
MDLNKLTLGDRIIGISGILLLIFSFFPWLGVSVSGTGAASGFGGSASKGAWSFILCLLAVLLGVLMVGYVIVSKLTDTELPKLGSVPWSQIMLGVSVVIILFIVIKIITGPGGVDTGSFGGVTVSKERKIGIFLGLLASIGLGVGAFLNAKELGELPSFLGGGKGGEATPPTA